MLQTSQQRKYRRPSAGKLMAASSCHQRLSAGCHHLNLYKSVRMAYRWPSSYGHLLASTGKPSLVSLVVTIKQCSYTNGPLAINYPIPGQHRYAITCKVASSNQAMFLQQYTIYYIAPLRRYSHPGNRAHHSMLSNGKFLRHITPPNFKFSLKIFYTY